MISSFVVVPHRPVTQSPPRSKLEAMFRPPSEQVAWPTPQGQQYTSCWPLETSRHTWTLRGNTTVLGDYVLAMTTAKSLLQLKWQWAVLLLVLFHFPSPPVDVIWAAVIVWRIRGKIIRTVHCGIVYYNNTVIYIVIMNSYFRGTSNCSFKFRHLV